jgi:hypothetical protein
LTLDQFRSNPVLVGAMRELIHGDGSNPTVLAQAIVAIQAEGLTVDARDHEPELVSVRRLSRMTERQVVISDLLSCADPMPPPQQDEEPTFGVRKQDFQPPPQP